MTNQAMLIPNRCIFFHKTACSRPSLAPREACAVESAARTNRNFNVFVLLLADGYFAKSSEALVNILKSYNNVYIRRIRLAKYVRGTPIETWFRKYIRKLLAHPDWIRKNFHDYIRMLTLWKYGGIALNLDSVVQTRLDKLATFAGMQNDVKLDIDVFGVDTSTNFGRKFVDTCMDIMTYINVINYAQFSITNIIHYSLRKHCYNVTRDASAECQQFRLYMPQRFYPTFFTSWRNYFNGSNAKKTMKVIKDAMKTHLWDDYSRNTATAKSTAAYTMVAKKYCPKIYEYTGGVF